MNQVKDVLQRAKRQSRHVGVTASNGSAAALSGTGASLGNLTRECKSNIWILYYAHVRVCFQQEVD